MSDVTIKYKGQSIATMDATSSKTLHTQGKYCEGDIGVEYVKPVAPSGTKQISITENGTTTEDVAAYANAEITVNVQGGGSSIQLLGTITVPSDTRAVSIDTTPYNSYDFYFCIIDATLTASDWIYVVKNGTSPEGGAYSGQSAEHVGLLFSTTKAYFSSKVYFTIIAENLVSASNNAPDNVLIYTYSAGKQFMAGSTFKIYGGNYADM